MQASWGAMAYPPATLDIDATNAMAMLNEHPARHNELAQAINDIVTYLTTALPTGGVELGFASNATYTGVAMNTTPADAAGLSCAPLCTGSPMYITAVMPATTITTAGEARLIILEDGNIIQIAASYRAIVTANTGTVIARVRRQPSAGSHTYKGQMASSANTGSYSSGAAFPAFIAAVAA